MRTGEEQEEIPQVRQARGLVRADPGNRNCHGDDVRSKAADIEGHHEHPPASCCLLGKAPVQAREHCKSQPEEAQRMVKPLCELVERATGAEGGIHSAARFARRKHFLKSVRRRCVHWQNVCSPADQQGDRARKRRDERRCPDEHIHTCEGLGGVGEAS